MNAEAENDYREFVAGQLQPLLRTAYLLCGQWHTAEDLVQITLVQLYRAWPRAASWEEPRAYARQMLTNNYLSARRRRWRGEQPVADLPADRNATRHPDPTGAVADREWQRQLLMRLPPRQRAVLVLRFWDDFDVAGTARLLGISPGTVKSQTADGLATLRQALAEQSRDEQELEVWP
jgi:RNA polymerase sigma-70 factor (sigma-E family)